MQVQKKKIVPLDSLRGLAALSVLLTHIRDNFFNDHLLIFNSNFGDYRLIVNVYSSLMFFLFHTGNLSVHLFWMLSGYVISIRYISLRDSFDDSFLSNLIRQSIISRYFRLFIPVFAVCIFVYFLASLDLLNNEELIQILDKSKSDAFKFYINFSPSILETVNFSFFYCPILLKSYFNPPLWTISYELWGSIFVYLFLWFFGKNNYRYIVYFLVITLFYYLNSYFTNFFLGLFLVDFKHTDLKLKRYLIIQPKFRSFNSIVLFVYIFLIWSGFSIIDHIFVSKFKLPHIDIIISCLLIMILVDSGPHILTRYLSSRPCLFLGKISFGVYLLHQPILCSLGISAYLFIFKEYDSRVLSTIISALVSIPFIFSLAWLFQKTVDYPSVKISKSIGYACIDFINKCQKYFYYISKI